MATDLGPNGRIHLNSKVDAIRGYKEDENSPTKVSNSTKASSQNEVSSSSFAFHWQVKVEYHCIGLACNASDEVTGDFVVVTSSAPMTAGIVFEPILNETQWHGIRAMHYSRAVKVGLAFSDSWWKSKEFTHIGLAGGISTDLNFYEMWIPPTKEDVSNGKGPSRNDVIAAYLIIWTPPSPRSSTVIIWSTLPSPWKMTSFLDGP